MCKTVLPRGDREDFDATCVFFFVFFWMFVDVSLAVIAGWCSSLKIGSGVCLRVCVRSLCADGSLVRGDVLTGVTVEIQLSAVQL